MPIIEITSLPPQGSIDVAAALARVTTEVAAYLGEDPRGRWRRPSRGVRGGRARARTQPRGSHPAIVDLFAGRREDPAALMRSSGVPSFEADGGNGVVVRLTDADDAHVWWGERGTAVS